MKTTSFSLNPTEIHAFLKDSDASVELQQQTRWELGNHLKHHKTKIMYYLEKLANVSAII